jgi:uncharacterized protein (UPF0264 family)
MQLLVSVASAGEAGAALAGGADVIDAKDPHAGALGPVSVDVLREIHAAVGGAQPVSAALGDASDEAVIEAAAHAFTTAGARFVKVGFGKLASAKRIATLIAAAVRGANAARGAGSNLKPSPPAILQSCHFAIPGIPGDGGVVAVWYADMASLAGPAPAAFVETAARAGAAGVLLDTANKCGPGLRRLAAPSVLAAWVAKAHDAKLIVALAGQLTADDLEFVRDAGADIAGVRGAACDEGRTGRVTAERVRLLSARLAL